MCAGHRRTFGRLIVAAATVAAAVVGGVEIGQAQGPTAMGAAAMGTTRVIELFTSQGCPKCPAADRLIADLAREPGTIALSFPVNYWDYIGWKDTLASNASTRRQHAYAAARGDGLIYTPQAIVDGVAAHPGADRGAILQATETLKSEGDALSARVHLSETNGKLGIDVSASGDRNPGPVGIYVLRVVKQKTVEIGRGENSGRSLTYTNVVRAMDRVGEWDGRAQHFELQELKGDDEGFVVLLQAGTLEKPGAILAAAKTANL